MNGIINIAGAMPRIGTTTVALQLVLFLKRMGYNAAYIEMNAQDYIWGTTTIYPGCIKDKLPGKITYNEIEMYSRERLPELVSGGTHYDYLICDFGNIQTKNFDMNSFTDCLATVIVSGAKPNEVFLTNQALKEPALADAIYVFSFISKADEAEISGMMQGKAEFTHFMPYCPDPFTVEKESKSLTDEALSLVMDNVITIMEGEEL